MMLMMIIIIIISYAVLSASVTSTCDLSSGSFGGYGFQLWRVAGNVLNKQQQTSDKGCPPVW
jgi:carbohydrate-binding DOMON domain-containing protein